MPNEIPSTSDDRTKNNSTRLKYRLLTDEEKAAIDWFKQTGEAFDKYCAENIAAEAGSKRELEIARFKIEEAVMWAVKGITA